VWIARLRCRDTGNSRHAVRTMTPLPGGPLTVPEFAALSEDDRFRWELQEGNLVRSPRPTGDLYGLTRCASVKGDPIGFSGIARRGVDGVAGCHIRSAWQTRFTMRTQP
jgi:hypothetical protein